MRLVDYNLLPRFRSIFVPLAVGSIFVPGFVPAFAGFFPGSAEFVGCFARVALEVLLEIAGGSARSHIMGKVTKEKGN